MTTPTTVRVRILDNDYQVACPPEEKDRLLSAARYLDDKMRAIKSSGNVIGGERVAVMAGLNIAHELLNNSRLSHSDDETLQRLTDKVARALGSQSQLEL
ncbi:MAG TPA: cell division protein ZapA [Pseudomonadales bacterium]|nr:cell division protein ZapA [Pseudomonadales bacterium]